jgi:Lysylphosphatidylglycerol synthase TM region
VRRDWKRAGRTGRARGQGRGFQIPAAALDGRAEPVARIARRVGVRTRAGFALAVTVSGAAALLVVLVGRRGQFSTAVLTAPVWLLSIAAVLHLTSLVTRSEAWNFCMRSAGGSTPRRVVFRAAGLGALASVLSAQLGVAMRIGAIRRTAPHTTPKAPALVAAEVPIVAVEATLAALFMFTLVGPLSLPPWTPVLVIAAMAGGLLGLQRLARSRRSGLWGGLAAVRELRGRGRLIALIVLGVLAQIARNWLVLRAVGVDTSILNAIAVLIVSVSLSPLPLGAGVSATATVLILGSHGLADTAAAGVLLTVTGTVAALCYASWACSDHALVAVRARRAAAVT